MKYELITFTCDACGSSNKQPATMVRFEGVVNSHAGIAPPKFLADGIAMDLCWGCMNKVLEILSVCNGGKYTDGRASSKVRRSMSYAELPG